MKKVISRITGGIGNQLFSYAAARRLAIVNAAELVLDTKSGFTRDYKYQRYYQLDHFNISCRKATPLERLEPFSRIRRYLKRTYNTHRPFMSRHYIQQNGVNFDSRLLDFAVKETVYLEGYWQSEKYFKDITEIIQSDLRISPPTDAMNTEFEAKIKQETAVAVHVRFFESPQTAGPNNICKDYYKQAITQMEEVAPNAHYFIFSDRPNDARNKIPLPDSRITCISHNTDDRNAYADLWLMTKCQHFIIANSTFSWWGAWLADNPSKHIIAPGFKLNEGVMSWGFEGLLPNKWIKI